MVQWSRDSRENTNRPIKFLFTVKVARNSIMAERPKNSKYCIIVKNFFCGIVSQLFRREKDISVAWMHMRKVILTHEKQF